MIGASHSSSNETDDDCHTLQLPVVGTYVCVRNSEAKRSLSLNSCHIGKVLGNFDLCGINYFTVELYLRPQLVPKNVDLQYFVIDECIDVLSDCRKCVASFDVKEIITECEVIPGSSALSVESTIAKFLLDNPCQKPLFVCRYCLVETEKEDHFVIEPLHKSLRKKMVRERSEVLSEKNIKVGRKENNKEEFLVSKSPCMRKRTQDEESPRNAREDVKENVIGNSPSVKNLLSFDEACISSPKFARASRATVRRSLNAELDGPPNKQLCSGKKPVASLLLETDAIVHLQKVDDDKTEAETDFDNNSKSSWVSELLDSNEPIVESDRQCATPIRLRIKQVRQDHTPSKEFAKESPSIMSEEETAVTPRKVLRRSTRKSKCVMYLAESTSDTDAENSCDRSSRCANKREKSSEVGKKLRTSGRKHKPTFDSGLLHEGSPYSLSSSKNVASKRTSAKTPVKTSVKAPAKTPQRSKDECNDLMSPEESERPLSKRTPGKGQCNDLMSPEESERPLSKRTPGKGECNDLMSPEESERPLSKRIPGKGEKTPRRKTETQSKTPVKSPRTPNTKAPSRIPSKGGFTPSMPARASAPLTPLSTLEQVRKNLHVSAVPMSLPCRESEYRNIYNFLENKIRDAAGGCMYISGVPGTGKTATVNAVIRSLKAEVEMKKLKDFQYIEVNGLRMTEPRQVFVQVLKALTGQKCTPQQAQDILAQRFCSSSSKNKTIVLLVDEVDMLRNRRQDVIYNLFDWPSKPNSRFIVLTIANTMDLPERLLKGRVTSRLGLTRLTFQPYSYKQLQEIVMSRLQGSNSFNDDAVQLVARKVAACSGDVRRALDICRRASELVEEGNSVTMPIVNKVVSQMMNSANVSSIKACSTLEKLFLQAVVAENERTGVEETSFISVYRQFQSLCALAGMVLINISEAMILLNRLGASGLLFTEHSRADINQSIFLNVNADDIHYALNQAASAS